MKKRQNYPWLHNAQSSSRLCIVTYSRYDIIKSKKGVILTELITSLGEPDSEIFFRYYYYNEKIKTISKAMNISLSTVKTKLYRGKQKLKNTIIKRRANDE